MMTRLISKIESQHYIILQHSSTNYQVTERKMDSVPQAVALGEVEVLTGMRKGGRQYLKPSIQFIWINFFVLGL